MSTISELVTEQDTLTFVPWRDHSPTFCVAAEPLAIAILAPTLGPSATLALHHIGVQMAAHNALAYFADTDDLARAIGGGSSRKLLDVALSRLVRFGYADVDRHLSVIRVRIEIPPLPRRHVDQLPAHVRQAYEALITATDLTT